MNLHRLLAAKMAGPLLSRCALVVGLVWSSMLMAATPSSATPQWQPGLMGPSVAVCHSLYGGNWGLDVDASGNITTTVTPFGDLGGHQLNAPIVAIASTPSLHGYWMAGSDGGVFGFGDARFYGSATTLNLTASIVGIAATSDGGGYWLVGKDGGVFAFGDARFMGSATNLRLGGAIVGIVSTLDARGYWLVGADGGVLAFGNAPYLGSMGTSHLNAPVVGMDRSSDGKGYILAAKDGGAFAYGDAMFSGSALGYDRGDSIVGILVSGFGSDTQYVLSFAHLGGVSFPPPKPAFKSDRSIRP